MKYGELNLEQIEAVVNKLGGMEGVSRFLRGELVVRETENFFAHDMRKEDWKLLEDTREPAHISVADLELISFLKKGEDYIKGEEMERRARKEFRANLGQRHAEYLLKHQEEITEEFRKYYLVFPGTIWRGRDSYRHVPCLDWDGERWCLSFHWLGDVWGAHARLVRPRE